MNGIIDITKLTTDDVNRLTNEQIYSLNETELSKIDSDTVSGILLVSKIRVEKMRRKDAEMYALLMDTKRKNELTTQKLDETIKKVNDTKTGIENVDKNYEAMKDRFSTAIDKLVNEVGGMMIGPPSGEFKVASIKEVIGILKSKKKIGVLTGAGLSVASGVSTFRGPAGLYEKTDDKGLKPEEFLTRAYFQKDPTWVWKWHLDFLKQIEKAKPNPAHEALLKMLIKTKEKTVDIVYVTQNIDSFEKQIIENNKNLREASIEVLQIHGDIKSMRCAEACCKDVESLDSLLDPSTRRCSKCSNSLMRPNVLWFDEPYTEDFYKAQTARSKLSDCEVLIVVGSTLQTSLPLKVAENFAHKGKPIIEINPQPILKWNSVFRIEGKCEEIVPNLVEEFLKSI